MPSKSSESTGNKILLAAETLFAEFGLNGVSLRQITARAGVNLASVNYHFNDKESLYREIIIFRIREVNTVRNRLMDAAESNSPNALVPLREILEIVAKPLFEPVDDSSNYNPCSMRLLGRILTEPFSFTPEILSAEYDPTMRRFAQAFRRHFLQLPPADFIWHLSLVIGAMHHALATLHAMQDRTQGLCRNHDAESALKNFIRFGHSALSAAAPA